MDFSQLKELLSLVEQSTLRDFNLQMDNVSVQMSKNNPISSTITTGSKENEKNSVVDETKQTTDLSGSVLKKETEQNDLMSHSTKEKEGDLVRSPIVGIAYLSPSPDK
ncbi:MAG: acetyl-CoA carboxylase, biotin carboxyl carrier protein, partial [Pisciglobus halotolerans]|nr:acetyl-CoA carboxylase, biotin carboxyl carrier protein [Pisciglobus halotolerans]